MSKEIDYCISDKVEKTPVGYIKDCYSGETIEYYCEKTLLEEYKILLNYMGYSGVNAGVYRDNNKVRDGLRYSLIEIDADEFGIDYTKEQYEKSFYSKDNNIEHGER